MSANRCRKKSNSACIHIVKLVNGMQSVKFNAIKSICKRICFLSADLVGTWPCFFLFLVLFNKFQSLRSGMAYSFYCIRVQRLHTHTLIQNLWFTNFISIIEQFIVILPLAIAKCICIALHIQTLWIVCIPIVKIIIIIIYHHDV